MSKPVIALAELVDGFASLRPETDLRSLGAYLLSGESGQCRAIIVDRSTGPVAEAKFAVRASSESSVRREFDVLSDLQASGSSAAACTPQPLGLIDLTPGPVAYYSHLSGRRVTATDIVDSADVRAMAVSWVFALHLSRRRMGTLSEDAVDTLLRQPAREALRRSGADKSFVDALERGLAPLESIAGETVPFVTGHGNMEARNLILRSGRPSLGITGWEFSRWDSLPLFDLFDCFISSAQARYGLTLIDAAALCARSDAALAREFCSQIAAYLDILEWSPKRLDLWLVAYFTSRCSARALASPWQWVPASDLAWVLALQYILDIGSHLDQAVSRSAPQSTSSSVR